MYDVSTYHHHGRRAAPFSSSGPVNSSLKHPLQVRRSLVPASDGDDNDVSMLELESADWRQCSSRHSCRTRRKCNAVDEDDRAIKGRDREWGEKRERELGSRNKVFRVR